MTSRLNPYISFKDNAREAMTFYQQALGGELTISTFGEYGGDASVADGVMHSLLETPDGLVLMASDTPPGMPSRSGDNISISLSGDDGDSLRALFSALAEGGTVDVPLEKQMWGDEFGSLTDRFGIGWLVNISEA
jgi:PhnB protein